MAESSGAKRIAHGPRERKMQDRRPRLRHEMSPVTSGKDKEEARYRRQWRDWNRRRRKGNRNKWITTERRWSEWEQRRSRATSGKWDTAARQTEWHTSAASAVNNTTYGKAVAKIITAAAEAGDAAAEAKRTEMTNTPTIMKPSDATGSEWEQRRSKVTLNTWDFRHAATTKQTKWHTSTAASNSRYGIIVEEISNSERKTKTHREEIRGLCQAT